jgi:hypothetical protein
VIVSSPGPGSFDIAALCRSIYGNGSSPNGVNGSWITGWECNTGHHQITFAQMQHACNHERPGYVLVNEQQPNQPAWGNAWFKCVSPSSTNNAMLINGFPPSTRDVSTMQPGKPFYAVANFVGYVDLNTGANCGMPCWAPVYPAPHEPSDPVHHPEAITHGWPCQAYLPSTGYCTNPPAGRTAAQRWVPKFAYSGDKVLVVCQTQGETIWYSPGGPKSNWWDGIAVPASKLNALGHQDHLKPAPHMPGYVIGLVPDILFGNTNNRGQHQLQTC